MLNQKEKEKIVEKFKTHPTDTGSPEIQAALLSEEMKQLASHLKAHPKDFYSKRGLLKMVAKRRTVLSYLKREDETRHKALIKKLDIRQ
ncbi:MAG: 30S ribosomal protein S15 [Candidatus Wildermuthbacteria bacterium]|nr:30S ribosomal protein S15 [Candidatus Wildermuthbacteria bacterium]